MGLRKNFPEEDSMHGTLSCIFLMIIGRLAHAVPGNDDDSGPGRPKTREIDPLERIQKLEREVEQLRAEHLRRAGLPPALRFEDQEKKGTPKTEVEFKASFTDGFHLKSSDGDCDLHVGGRWEEEYRYTFNRHSDGALRTSTNSFYVREAFLSLDGTLFHDWGFKVNGDFASPQTQTVGAVPANLSTGAIVEECWVEWKSFKEVRILFGSFKQPASFEITDSPRFAALIQRSPMARFLPNFDTGIKVHATLAHEGQNAGINPVGWPGNLATNELAVNYMALALPATGRFAGDRYRVGGEFTYAYGPLMIRGEMMQRRDEYVIPGAGKNGLLAISGYYAEAAFMVTGEDRIPNARLVPKR